MIGCDKCEEWYHPHCVALDLAQIPDLDSYEFTCPPCKAAADKKKKKTHSSAAPTSNNAATA